MSGFLIKLLNSQRGATAIEYGMIVGVIAMTMLIALSTVGGRVSATWTNLSTRTPDLSS